MPNNQLNYPLERHKIDVIDIKYIQVRITIFFEATCNYSCWYRKSDLKGVAQGSILTSIVVK